MSGLGEMLFLLLWRLLPEPWRLRLSEGIRNVQARAARPIPVSSVTVYPFSKETQKIFTNHLAPEFELGARIELDAFPKYTLIATCRNEEATIAELLDALKHQSVPPVEVVLCDGGSSDRTLERIEQWRAEVEGELPFALRVLEAPRISIAEGRNRAVAVASEELLLLTDAGSKPERVWAERLLTPFVVKPETEVSMGYYKTIARGRFQQALMEFFHPRLSTIAPETFLPSGRSLALRREFFTAVGGYPEHLTLAGEDSLFDYYLKTAASRFAFVPDAIAFWSPPQGVLALARTIRRYARGDAETGYLFWEYYTVLLRTFGYSLLEAGLAGLLLVLALLFSSSAVKIAALVVFACFLLRIFRFISGYLAGVQRRELGFLTLSAAVLFLTVNQAIGFLRGLRSLREVEARRVSQAARGHCLLLYPQYHRFSSGSAETKLVLELIQEGYYLTLVYAQAQEMPTLSEPSFEHPQLENHLRSAFQLEPWLRKHEAFFSDSRELVFLDLCQDALSAELLAELEHQGARSLSGFGLRQSH